jgi:dipeptidyl-peptidase-4
VLNKLNSSSSFITIIFLKPRKPGKIFFLWILFFLSLPAFIFAQPNDRSLLTLDRIFSSREFDFKRLGGFRWQKKGDSYARLEPSATIKGAMDLVSYDAETNKRTVLLPAEKLIPRGTTAPLSI